MNEDPDQQFVTLYTRFEPDIRAFIRSLLPTWTDAEEVLQQTALVIWKKFDQFEEKDGDPRSFLRWAFVIARFESLSYRRSKARDRLTFPDDLVETLALEAEEEINLRTQEHDALEHCLHTLPDKQRQLIQLAYTPGVVVKEIAEASGSSAEAFYMRINRTRKALLHCMENRLSPT